MKFSVIICWLLAHPLLNTFSNNHIPSVSNQLTYTCTYNLLPRSTYVSRRACSLAHKERLIHTHTTYYTVRFNCLVATIDFLTGFFTGDKRKDDYCNICIVYDLFVTQFSFKAHLNFTMDSRLQ